MEYYHKAELWNREKITDVQLARLKAIVSRSLNCDFYKKRLDEAGLSSINNLDDLKKIPFTTKDDLRAEYPFGLLCVPQKEIVRMHCSSGTTGNPVALLHTRNDLNCWADLMARSMFMAGVRKSDIFQNMSGYGLFTGGLGIHAGAERLGCMTIPAGSGNSARQIKIMRDFGTTVAHILPSYAMILGENIRKAGLDPRDLALRIALVGAEPYSHEFRQKLENIFNIKVYNSYGLSEMNGPGVGFECEAQNGLHIWEDAYILEIVDPVTGEETAPGEIGEIVLTTLFREGMPILRYRTRDLARLLPGKCACGREHLRISPILGRCDDMMIIKGVNIYPMQIEKILMSFMEVGKNYLIILEDDGPGERMRVLVEIADKFFVEDMRALQNLQARITQALKNEILITPKVELVQNNTVPQSDGKAKRVLDKRTAK